MHTFERGSMALGGQVMVLSLSWCSIGARTKHTVLVVFGMRIIITATRSAGAMAKTDLIRLTRNYESI